MKKVAFVHVAKAAGSSINDHFLSVYKKRGKNHCESIIDSMGSKETKNQLDFFSGHINYKIMYDLLGVDFYYFSFLRNPVHHLWSHLNWVRDLAKYYNADRYNEHPEIVRQIADRLIRYDISKEHELRAYFDSMSIAESGLFDNCQTRYFCDAQNELVNDDLCRAAIKSIDVINFVGLVEYHHECLHYVCNEIGIMKPVKPVHSNANKKAFKVNDLPIGVLRLLGEKVEYDAKLYVHARGKLESLKLLS